ncbi:MAG: DUF192 domain-containing protein [Balneolaceae bacterium]
MFFYSCSETNENEQNENPSRTLEYTATVDFIGNNGEVITTIEAAVADNDQSRSEGLMDVYNLPSGSGMLFLFDDNQQRSFWMANTPLSLDIIFVNENLEIVRIHRNTPPYSDQSIPSEQPAKYVVEVNAGFTLKHDITEGMSVHYNL